MAARANSTTHHLAVPSARSEQHRYEVTADACIGIGELAAPLEAAGYGARAGHLAAAIVDHALAAYTFVAHARTEDGRLAGYVGAFSDGAFATFIAALVTHPDHRGADEVLVRAVERHCTPALLMPRRTNGARRTA